MEMPAAMAVIWPLEVRDLAIKVVKDLAESYPET
jgi:hypothetical protein